MFESKFLADHAQALSDPGQGGGGIRQLEWGELVARLAATRDARAALFSRRPGKAASFGGGAAEFLQNNSHCQPEINPDALSDGKATGGSTVDVADDAAHADEETK